MKGAAGIRCVRLSGPDTLVEYVAWRCNVELLLRRLRAIGGIGEGTTYVLDILDENRDIVDDVRLTKAGVSYLRMKKMLRRKKGPSTTDPERGRER